MTTLALKYVQILSTAKYSLSWRIFRVQFRLPLCAAQCIAALSPHSSSLELTSIFPPLMKLPNSSSFVSSPSAQVSWSSKSWLLLNIDLTGGLSWFVMSTETSKTPMYDGAVICSSKQLQFVFECRRYLGVNKLNLHLFCQYVSVAGSFVWFLRAGIV